MEIFASCSRGVEDVLASELRALGASAVATAPAGATFAGDERSLMRAALWLRTASRLLVPLLDFPFASADDIYDAVRAHDWSLHLTPSMTLAVDPSCREAEAFGIRDHRYAGMKVKDAIVDRLRERFGARPNVDRHDPDVLIAVRIVRDRCSVSLDASGETLHRRGYRGGTGDAPLKETVAAAAVLLAGWRGGGGDALLDPFCGSGTILAEALWIALDRAPRLLRPTFGFQRWLGYDRAAFERLFAEAGERARAGEATRDKDAPPVVGRDIDPRAIRACERTLRAAQVERHVRLEVGDARDARAPAPRGVIVTNPPWGERLGETQTLKPLFKSFGDVLKNHFKGWTAHLLVGNPDLAKSVGLRPARRIPLWDAAIECRLLRYELY